MLPVASANRGCSQSTASTASGVAAGITAVPGMAASFSSVTLVTVTSPIFHCSIRHPRDVSLGSS